MIDKSDKSTDWRPHSMKTIFGFGKWRGWYKTYHTHQWRTYITKLEPQIRRS